MKRVLITGGAGFSGHHFVEHFLKKTDFKIIVFDKLTYASNGFDRLRDIKAFNDKRVLVFSCDFSNPISKGIIDEVGHVDYIIHMGAETHVDKSIEDPAIFVRANVFGTMNMLNFARVVPGLKLFVYFSTDEVFGPAQEGVSYDEWSRYNSGNPYAATKAGGEELCLAYANTYNVPVIITHTMNMFAERQHPEKFIPLCIRRILNKQKILIHADEQKINPGKRSYIHCRNVAKAVHFIIDHHDHFPTETGKKINIVGEKEVDNLQMVKFIAKKLGIKPIWELTDFHSSRPGHDLRYALSGDLLKRLGFQQEYSFERSLSRTIDWYLNNKRWL